VDSKAEPGELQSRGSVPIGDVACFSAYAAAASSDQQQVSTPIVFRVMRVNHPPDANLAIGAFAHHAVEVPLGRLEAHQA
jgi:hypothetical protein